MNWDFSKILNKPNQLKTSCDFISIFWGSSGDQPQAYLAKFGDVPNMKLENLMKAPFDIASNCAGFIMCFWVIFFFPKKENLRQNIPLSKQSLVKWLKLTTKKLFSNMCTMVKIFFQITFNHWYSNMHNKLKIHILYWFWYMLSHFVQP